jgi:hypothetical protein
MFLGLRGQFLRANPSDFGLKPTSALPRVWGALVDMGLPNGVASLLSIADGTTSLYTSTGGGIVGGGFHESVRVATAKLLGLIESALGQFEPRLGFELPAAGRFAFVVRTYEVDLGTEVSLADFASGTHRLAPVFVAANDVLTALHMTQDKLNASGGAREWRPKER